MKTKILLLDADSLIYICASKETLVDAVAEFDARFKAILEATQVTGYIGYLSESTCFRHKIGYSYKKNRKNLVPPKWLSTLKQYARIQYNFISDTNVEADDLVGIAKTYLTEATIESTVASIDKDVLYQLPGTHFNYRFNKETEQCIGYVTTTEEQAKKFLALQSLMGDSTDGISGIKGVGEVKALKYLESTSNTTLEDLMIAVMKRYLQEDNSIVGIKQFFETVNLVYILRTLEDYEQATGESIDLNKFTITEIKTIETW